MRMPHLFGLSCQDITRLVSESMDHPLPLTQRMKIRIHLGMCKYCAGFAKQMRFLRKMCRTHEAPRSEATLSAEARNRIRQAIHTAAPEH
jgi:Putative zinc-finger